MTDFAADYQALALHWLALGLRKLLMSIVVINMWSILLSQLIKT